MKRKISSDRRDGGRRKDNERRGRKRREHTRLVYPQASAPKVLNANFNIIDISQKGISFVCRDDCENCKKPISINKTIDLKIQFHDDEIIRVRFITCTDL